MNFFSRIHLALIAQLCFIAPLSTHAQFVQQGNKLVGIGAVGTVHQGQSVAISADGNTAIVGGNGDNNTAGATWVFTRSGGVWTQQGNKLVGTGAVNVARQGLSVAISADGNTTVVGGPLDNYDTANYSYRGATWVFTRTNGIWTQQGNKLVGTGAVGGAYQGRSVAISADGNTAIVGGNDDNNNAGATWVFTRSGGVWTQQGSKLVGTDAIGLANQGWSGSLSADGNTAIVGGFGDNDGVGAVWVFTRSAGVWTEQGSKLVGTGAVSTARQGYSVSISSDGNTALVGGYYDNNYTGAIWVFTRTGGVWTQQGSKLVGTGAVGGAYQGTSVAISADGNTALVGGNDITGAVWVFTRTGGVWTQLGSKLVGTGAVGGAYQGTSVAISADGNTAFSGGEGDNGGVGAAWIFSRPAVPILFSSAKSKLQRLNLENNQLLHFNLSNQSQVTIRLYDSKGAVVKTLLNEVRSAGDYLQPLPKETKSNSYLLDFKAGEFHKTMKIDP